MTNVKKQSPRKLSSLKDKRIKLTELSPDGVRIVVDWDEFPVGASVFVPAIDCETLHKHLQKVADIYGWSMETRTRIENSKLGVRIWRVL